MQIDFGSFLQIDWNPAFFLSFLNIIFINLILSGDNAVLIAMAVRNLPKSQRMKGITFGSAVAIFLRVVLTYFVAILLEVSFIKLVGGFLILWIAIQLFMEAGQGGGDEKDVTTMLQAIKIILIADITMSLDNVLAVAGAAGGNVVLLIFGLLVSIPIVIFTSNLISTLMDKYPSVIVLGGAILGKVGGEMVVTDPAVERWLHPSQMTEYIVQAICTIGVVLVGKLWMRWKIAKAEREVAVEELVHKPTSDPASDQERAPHPRQ
jgi:YjbE family integral membrane protein